MELKELNVSDILANFYQPRTKFDKEGIKELSESILSNGLINPITITPDKKRKGKYMIVSGERRWQAHKVAGLKTIQAVVKTYSTDGQFMVESLIENIHREDLTPLEKGKFADRIMKEEKISDVLQLSRRLSIPNTTLTDWFDEIKLRKVTGPVNVSSSVIRETKSLPEKQRIQLIKEAEKEDFGSREMRKRVSDVKEENKIMKEYNISPEEAKEEYEKNKRSNEGIIINISLNPKERKATMEGCKKEKLQMEILVKKNHIDWLKKERYL